MRPVQLTFVLILCVAVFFSGIAFTNCIKNESDNTSAAQSEEVNQEKQNESISATDNTKPTVVVLSTGGTIAGSGEAGKSTGYQSGAISGDDLVDSVPQLLQYANIVTEEVCNVNSDDITAELWIKLSNRITELSKNEKVKGFVITHGTDTMEETAYFLNLTAKTDKPIVITGSMRPSTAVSPDGPSNLLEAVKVACDDESSNRGVLCVFSDLIYPARTFSKTSSYAIEAMSSGDTGACGIVRDDGIYFFNETTYKHTTETEFDVSDTDSLPEVNTVYFEVDANPNLLTQALEMSSGIVINGAGAGEYNNEFKEIIANTDKPVMITSHSGNGTITQNSTLLPKKTVACSYLTSQKAQVLLRLCLLKNPNISFDELLRIAEEY